MNDNYNGRYNGQNQYGNINQNGGQYGVNNQYNTYNQQYYYPYGYNNYSSGKYPGSNAFTFGLLALIFSAFALCLTPTISIVFGILAIAEANRAKKFMCANSRTKSGKIMGIIGIVLSVALFAFFLILFIILVAAYPNEVYSTTYGLTI